MIPEIIPEMSFTKAISAVTGGTRPECINGELT
jgi:hypothetical protein